MLKYDYLIERDIGEVQLQKFVPSNKIGKELPNLVYIEGPNSSGKSTLLNIIALGLLGNKSKKIDQTLINKINSLINSNYQKIKFNFEISTPDESLLLRSVKNDLNLNEIRLEENIEGKGFKPMSFERFESKYNLIYDIPNNPTERLRDLLDEIREEQIRYGNKMSSFHIYLRGMLSEITQYRDPERLKKLKDTIKDLGNRKRKLEIEIPELVNLLDSLEKYACVKFYAYYLSETERIRSGIVQIEEEGQDLKVSKRKTSTKHNRLRRIISNLQDEVRALINNLTPLIEIYIPNIEKGHSEIWKELNIYGTINYEIDNTIETETIHFLTIFNSMKLEIESNDSYENAYAIDSIIQFLEEYKNTSILIPKLKINIKEFIVLLEEENKENRKLIDKYSNIELITQDLERLKIKIRDIKTKLVAFKDTVSKDISLTEEIRDFGEETSQLKYLNEEYHRNREKRDFYLKKCIAKEIDVVSLKSKLTEVIKEFSKNKDLEVFFSMTEYQLESRILSIQKDIAENKRQVIEYDVLLGQYVGEKEKLEKQEPHKYGNNKYELEKLVQKTEMISQKLLREYRNLINKLISDKVKKYVNKGEEKYYNEVSKYLAFKIGEFRHIEDTYKAKSVDLVQGIIITENNLTIHLSDMGTGQSQSAYILGLLNVKNDDRKIIALFDEIAMMDDSSLEPIYEKLRKLYRTKRLLLGILVQRANHIKVVPLYGDHNE